MKISTGEKTFYSINNIVIFIVSITCMLPLLYIVATSFSSGSAIQSGKVYLWPVEFTPAAYKVLFVSTDIFKYFWNSVVLTGVGTILSLVFTILCAYPLSKKKLFARKKITFFVVFTMLFAGGMIPSYLLVKSLGLMNSYWSIWLTMLISPYNMLIMKSFFENIPEELEESARIDGCSEWRILLQMYLPLSKAVIATLCLFYGVAYWNNFLKVLMYINDSKGFTLPVLIQQMVFQLEQIKLGTSTDLGAVAGSSEVISESVKSAGVVVLILPMLAVYPFIQKYFVKGVMLGSVKG
ncbi:carbohydrate ABC transporter permease [Paenibacillus sp. G2S3]|uniref:carbohydrate ABC transporter permease n=1 Tax=Paenibacillus sp. G2S3 TaxID=3047872 RepID=UPI0024C155EE|nr:carbohydrate ABC transporter permease [Paenibacillus sp. G2S3]WHY21393.1 carbohydrate ABC transporter permease [Paenibacillus sp. G2S3]